MNEMASHLIKPLRGLVLDFILVVANKLLILLCIIYFISGLVCFGHTYPGAEDKHASISVYGCSGITSDRRHIGTAG